MHFYDIIMNAVLVRT